MVYSPADPTVIVRWNPVVSLIATTVAPGTTAPEVSVTDPDMAPVPPWPNKAPVNRKTAVIARKRMAFTLPSDSAVSLRALGGYYTLGLTRKILQLATRSHERTSRGVVEIAADVGHESEAAFDPAFKP